MLRFLTICEVLCISGMLQGCDVDATTLEATEVRDIGLPASGVPPSGEGIAPIYGRGGDGAPVVVAVGGWSTGPGAVKWHGGQWVIPYAAQPGSLLANAWCDVVPRADATALVELVSSNGQVLGSNTVPATTANVVVRLWPFAGSHSVADGEQVVMRISPKDSTTGAWTSAAQDMTVIGCAIRATEPAEIDIPAVAWSRVVSSAGFPSLSSDGVWSFDPSNPNEIGTSLTLPSTSVISSILVHFNRNNAIHPSVGNVTVRVSRRNFGATSTTSQSANLGSAFGTQWTSVDVAPLLSGSLALSPNQVIWLSISTSGFLGFGDPSPLFDSAVVAYN